MKIATPIIAQSASAAITPSMSSLRAELWLSSARKKLASSNKTQGSGLD